MLSGGGVSPLAQPILVLGAGDIGSAIAVVMRAAGAEPILVEGSAPTTTRRRMAFADAAFDGSCELAGLMARRVTSRDELAAVRGARRVIPLWVGDRADLRWLAAPILIDARMRKREVPDIMIEEAALVVGLGPGFEVGRHCHVAIETAHGPRLGARIDSGCAAAYDGVPREVAGTRRERHVRADAAGKFAAAVAIGDAVAAGAPIGAVDGVAYVAGIAGTVRGVVRDGVAVQAGTRLAEIVPAGSAVALSGIGDRPRTIAEGVLRVVALAAATGSSEAG